ncbi:hypothetical protein EQJ27_15415 (plasmid) [Lactiplantibacillus plantarum]|nr:hypothetical protein EQJ27_15315 [Lactiplantibacillus plantarum]QAR39293.1 hypothetical protein EQJ27_15415 [Lactiplantibacillus plantarum]RWZ05207.1 hypothetical protein EQG51_15295 [Lactiplantibacillus plantarum]
MGVETMNKVFKIAKKFYTDIRYYSFQLACIHLGETFSWHTKFNLADKYYLKKDKIVLNYLRTRYTNSPKQDVYGGVPKIYQPIWVFWYQGEEQMPKLVSACLKSVRNNANGHEVILISKKNMNNYIKIPDIIRDRVESKKISLAHYSDIIRMCLLAEYGGLWIDSTVLVTQLIPQYIFELPLFTIKNSPNQEDPLYFSCVSHLRWTSYVMGGEPNNALFTFVRDLLIEYNSVENAPIDYLLLDYAIELAIEKNSSISDDMIKIPINNQLNGELVHRLFSIYPDCKTKELLQSGTIFFKLSYKKVAPKVIEKNNYQLLVDGDLCQAYNMGN